MVVLMSIARQHAHYAGWNIIFGFCLYVLLFCGIVAK